MPLRITQLGDPGQVGVLNRWADGIERQLKATNTKIFAVANTAVAAIPPTVSSKPVTDGLIHGDAIWELDPAWIILRDDFNNPNAIPTPSTTFGNGLNWTLLGTWFPVPGGPFPLNGVLEAINGSSSSTGFIIKQTTGTSSGGNGFPLLDYPGWKMIWIFQIQRNGTSIPAAFSWTKVSFYTGLANYVSGAPTTSNARPPHFMGLRYDTDTAVPAISDTQFVFEYVNNLSNVPLTKNNTQGITFNTGITATEGRIYRFEMSCQTSGKVLFFLTDGVTSVSDTMMVAPISFNTNQPTFSTTNGVVFSSFGGSLAQPIEFGTKVTISGGSIVNGNGTFTASFPRGVTSELAFLSSTIISGTDTGATSSYYPGLAPYVAFSNDSQATPTAASKGVLVDYFGFVWNKGLGTSGATPNSLLPRYW